MASPSVKSVHKSLKSSQVHNNSQSELCMALKAVHNATFYEKRHRQSLSFVQHCHIVKHCLQVCTRLLTVCIVIYRYVLVLHSSLVETSAQKRMFQCLILATIFLLPVLVSSYGVYYRNYYHNYLGRGANTSPVKLNILHIFQSVRKDSMSFSTTSLISTSTSPSPGPVECTGDCP